MNELDQALVLSEKMLAYAQQSVWDQVGQLERQRRGLYQRLQGSRRVMKVEKVQAIIVIDREIVRLRCRCSWDGEGGWAAKEPDFSQPSA